MDMKQVVESLANKAEKAPTGSEAMVLSQAACNVAKAFRELTDIETITKKT